MTFSSSALSLRLLLTVSSAFALALAIPPAGLAAEQSTTTVSPPAETTSSTTPAPEAPPAPATPSAGSTVQDAPTSTPATTPAPAPASSEAPVVESAPQVQAEHAQGSTPGAPIGAGHAHAKKTSGSAHGEHEEQVQSTEGSSSLLASQSKRRAPSPTTLTPALPLALDAPISGVPSFFIESFRIPPFLLPIYQAAGTAYGIPWQVLAAINEVETDYGRDLSVSSAGAEGWMQFLPAEWEQYGVDANGAGFKDPYNPADAIFAAARYLRAAGGDRNIRAAVYSYNHSQAYVASVMLRAQLLGGTPPELLGAITGLTEARFPVYAPSHYSDGFATVTASDSPGTSSSAPRTLVGTTIYSQAGAPVIAVQDGEIVQVGDSPSLGRFVTLRDAYGNTYVYAQLGSVAALYPVLEPHEHSAASTQIAQPGAAAEPAPSGPATAGAQPRSPVSEGAAVSGFALGAPAALEPAPGTPAPAPAAPARPVAPSPTPRAAVRVFREGPDDVYLHPLRAGAQVLAGTVLGHVGAVSAAGTTAEAQPHMFFQIRPAGAGAPLIDPKPILDGWVALENTSIFRAKGENPFLATSPTVGQVLLESQAQLGPQVLHDTGIRLSRCGRQDVQTGRVGRRLLATLEFLSVSGLKPTVSGLRCGEKAPALEGNASASSGGDAVDIVAVNGTPIAGHEGPGSIADITVRKLLALQGAARPQRIISAMGYPGVAEAIDEPSVNADIRVAFSPAGVGLAHAADAFASGLTPNEWIKLISRLGEIPDPTVAGKPSAAAIPDTPGPAGSENGKEAAGGNG
jgi:murein DD-endopeptidase MepM/ murein hydrolase activator NlpD